MDHKTHSLKNLYETYTADRESFLTRARESSALTIPHLLPPNGHTSSSDLRDPWQSTGARGVNNLAARMLTTLMPPNESMFRFTIDSETMIEMIESGVQVDEIDSAMTKLESTVQRRLETGGTRPFLFEALRHLLVSGNYLMHRNKAGKWRGFSLDQFVVKRSPAGDPQIAIIEQTVYLIDLPPKVQQQLAHVVSEDKDMKKPLTMYTGVFWRDGKVRKWDEIEGIKIEGSEGEWPMEKAPYLALRYNRISGENYGRGFIEEYLGDLNSLEHLAMSITMAAGNAAKVIWLVQPGSLTSARELARAPNGAFRQGRSEDVTCLQLDKAADMQFALTRMSELKRDLELSFLLMNSIQRQAERVTAEEIRLMASELENALGGVYSLLSQELQLPIVEMEVAGLQKDGLLPNLGTGTLVPVITAGLESMSRSAELDRLRAFVTDVANIAKALEVTKAWLDPERVIARLANQHNLSDAQDLMTTREAREAMKQQAAQAQQAASQQQMIEKLGPAAMKSMTDMNTAALNQGGNNEGNPENTR